LIAGRKAFWLPDFEVAVGLQCSAEPIQAVPGRTLSWVRSLKNRAPESAPEAISTQKFLAILNSMIPQGQMLESSGSPLGKE
jgi:hypothetical protein